ncbi:hypothetical protein CN689_25525 [Peribacillus butanolivorans]|uniref:Uncharacterized protein n=1 Tax=Peribacillus butanolivorans TaxID=421767 RepID=A0AAX0RXN7_9BACI|nr:hypothetical protein DTO10_03705 [Peribacillus butanolivorans]KQU17200.1 hypothetical protein ASG65_09910 [Bacillus sp. Leaf13]KRF60755.1 hypothetical protein ASG99_07395 [Bacillus sp. Soil768D1]PEJ26006.1 hypothetical protein CN689_25525 [Peribacillus butanolivorans]
MKLFIQLSAITLLLWTLHIPLQHHTQPLNLEEHTDVHHWDKAEKKLPFIPFLGSWQDVILFLTFEFCIFNFLYFHSNLRRRFLSPVFFQANYVSTNSKIL